MSDFLDFVIQAYQTEVENLRKAVDTWIAEKEFRLANFQQKALYAAEHRVDILKKIKDPLYPKKQFLAEALERARGSMENEPQEIHLARHYASILDQYQAELDALEAEQHEPQTEPFPEMHRFLVRLVKQELKNAMLVFDELQQITLQFLYKPGKLTLIISSPIFNKQAQGFEYWAFKGLKRLGFRRRPDGQSLSISISGSNEILVSTAELILARITFEAFEHLELSGGYLSFKEKPPRKA